MKLKVIELVLYDMFKGQQGGTHLIVAAIDC